MIKILKADKDTYITDRIANDIRSYSSNVGIGGSLDIFKLYGMTLSGSTPNLELSRLLLHFDMSSILDAISNGKLDPTHSSFFAKMQLFDVYGGQPTPNNFVLSINPLSMSFDEGYGKDVVFYGDYDVANFLTASSTSLWISPGCSESGSIGSSCDFFTGSVESTQLFVTGEEDLNVDVTSAVRALLTGSIPDAGFRIALSSGIEADNYSYFVKRFASRHAYDDSKHPRMLIGFDDSIRDDTGGITLDSTSTIFLFNYDHGTPTNLLSASLPVTGTSCLKLKLSMPISGGHIEWAFTGSQHYSGINPMAGVYSASIYIPFANSYVQTALASSGSVIKLTPIWGSLDGTVPYVTGSQITVIPPIRSSNTITPRKFVVTINGLSNTHRSDEKVQLRVNLFDYTTPFIKVVKVPTESPGALQGIASDAFYSVRDAVTQQVVIPFDTVHGSTRLSSDASSMFFELDMENLTKERTYVIDVMLIIGGNQQRYSSVSPIFKVSDLQ